MEKKISLLFIFSTLGVIVGYFILHMDLQASATGDLLVRLGKSLIYGMGALTIIFLILLFLPRAFSAWKKFAIWFIPIAVVIFIAYREPGSGDFFSPYPEQVFQWISALYVLVSLVIIAWSSMRGRS